MTILDIQPIPTDEVPLARQLWRCASHNCIFANNDYTYGNDVISDRKINQMSMFQQKAPSSAEVVHEQAGNLLKLARRLEEASRKTDDPVLKEELRQLTRGVAESSRELSGISKDIAQRRYKY